MSLHGLAAKQTCWRSWRQRGEDVQLGVTYVELFGRRTCGVVPRLRACQQYFCLLLPKVSDLLREGQVVGQGLEGRYSVRRSVYGDSCGLEATIGNATAGKKDTRL
eukprot:3892032-Amphidinium_carterae.1